MTTAWDVCLAVTEVSLPCVDQSTFASNGEAVQSSPFMETGVFREAERIPEDAGQQVLEEQGAF